MNEAVPEQRIQRIADVPALRVVERRGLAVRDGLFRIGLPLPRGTCFNPRNLLLLDDNDQPHPGDWQATAFWPDSSVKWVLLHGRLALEAGQARRLHLARRRANPPPGTKRPSRVVEAPDHLQVTTDAYRLRIDTQHFKLFDLESAAGERLAAGNVLLGAARLQRRPAQAATQAQATTRPCPGRLTGSVTPRAASGSGPSVWKWS